MRAIARIGRGLALVEGAGIGCCLVAVIGLATWQFVERNLNMHHVPFIHAPGWTDGVVRHSVFLLGFLGGAYATHTGRHIRIDAVTRGLRPSLLLALRIGTTLASFALCTFFVRAAYGFYLVTLEEAGEASQNGQFFTPSRGASIIVAGYGLIAFHFVEQLAIDIAGLFAGRRS